MTAWIAEIRVVNDDGRPGEILPDWATLSYLDPDNEAGQVILAYPTEGKRSSLLSATREYALLIDGEEIPNSRFRLDETSGNTVTEGSPQITWTGSTLMMRFDEILVVPNTLPDERQDVLTPEEARYKALVDNYEAALTRYRERLADWKRNGERGDKPRQPKRGYKVNDRLEQGLDSSPPPVPPTFKKDTPGQVLRYLVQNGQERGAASELTLGFSADRDSAGVRWEPSVTQQWDVGTSVYEVMRWMVENRLAEFRMVGRELKAYMPDTGVDRTDPHVLLARGKNLQDGPVQGTSKEHATAVFCVSDRGPHGWVRSGELIQKYGRIEAKMTVSGINTWNELEELGFRYLEQHGEPRYQYTYGVIPGRGADPYADYQQGDWVYVLDGETPTRRRVRQIGLSFDENRNAKIALTLHDLITEREIANAQAIRSLLGRTAQTSINSLRSRPAESLADGEAPVKPSAPVVTQRAGVVRIAYNGLDVDDQEAVWDQAVVEVHVVESPDVEVSTDTLYDLINGAGVTTLPDLAYDVPQYIKFVAVDAGGDRSEVSDPTPVTPVRIDGTMTSVGMSPVSVLTNSNMEDPEVQADGTVRTDRFAGWDTSYYNGNGGILSQNTATPISGTRSMRLTFATDADGMRMVTDRQYPVVPGQVWQISCRVRADRTIDKSITTGSDVFALTFHTSDGSESPQTVFGLSSQWQTVAAVDKAVAGEVITLSKTVVVPLLHRVMMVSVNCAAAGDGSGGWAADIDEIYAVQADRSFLVANDAGETVAAINQQGDTTVHDLTVTGTATLPLESIIGSGGESLLASLDRRGRGPIVRGWRDMSGVALPVGLTHVFTVAAFVEANRVVRFDLDGQLDSTTANNRYNLQVVYAYSSTGPPADPTTASPLLSDPSGLTAPALLEASTGAATGEDSETQAAIFASGLAAGYYKFAFLVRMFDGAGTARTTWLMHIQDVGAADNFLPNSAYWTGSAAAATSTKTFTVDGTDSRWWSAGGTYKGGGDSQFFGNSSATGEGNRKSVTWFNKTTIYNTLAGKVPDKVEAYLYLFDGGNNNNVAIGKHNDTSPTTVFGNVAGTNREMQVSSGWNEGSGRWVTLNTALRTAGWELAPGAAGSAAGLIIGPASSDADSYAAGYRGASAAASVRPKLRFTYQG